MPKTRAWNISLVLFPCGKALGISTVANARGTFTESQNVWGWKGPLGVI